MLRTLAMVVVSGALSTPVLAQAPKSGGDVEEQDLGTDHFVAGGIVRVEQPVAGDLIAAGGRVRVEASVKGDAVLAGGRLRVTQGVGNNLYAAGGQVMIDSEIGRNARIAGGNVELGPNAKIAGNLTVAGGEVRIDGAVHGYLQAGSGRIVIDGPVDGDVVAAGAHIELGPHARIGGKLRYAADDLRSDPAAQVAGGVERFSMGHAATYRSVHRYRVSGWFWTVGLMVLAAVLVGALPAVSARVGYSVRTHPWLALLLGFVALVCIPVAAILLMITIIGIPLALLVLLLYAAILLVGYVFTAISLADAALRRTKPDAVERTGWRIGAAILGVLVLALLARIPFVGGLILFVAMLVGIGAIGLALRPNAVYR